MGAENYNANFLFVDDGSKIPLKVDWKNATVLRIDEDIPWNMPRANNLGFSHLDENDVVLRMDIDHFITKEEVDILNTVKLQPKEVMKFRRKNASDCPPNIYLARVKDLIDVGGYNEVFCGNYGFEDRDLMDRLRNNGAVFTKSPIEIYVDIHKHTIGLDRDTTINKEKYLKLKNK